jgi:hypothetical protein
LRCASVSVGIVGYLDPYYRGSQMALRYAVSDAEAFHRYMCLAWPPADTPQHSLISDGDAIYDRLEGAIAAAAEGSPLDLFVLYLSGHGELGKEGTGWFCLSDARPGQTSLDGAALDRCLAPITANSIIVFIDCCHAETALIGSSTFASTTNKRARVVAASCRAHQRAWEDDGLKRSIFSDVLLRALSTDSPLADARGQVDLQAQLLPYLRDQIPIAASAIKRGSDQDPVTGGLLGGSVMLPVISSKSLGRPLTIPQAIRAGVRRFIVMGISAAIIMLTIGDLMIFHLAVDDTGEIVVRPGFAATYAAVPVHLVGSIDTGLSIRDVSLQNDYTLKGLATASIWGFATHRDAHGLKPWLSMLQPGLMKSISEPLRALAFGESPSLNIDRDKPPTVEALFLARLGEKAPSVIGRAIYPYDPSLSWDCSDSVTNQLDFTLLSADQGVFGRDVEWDAVTAAADAAAKAKILADIIKIAAYRYLNETDSDKRLAEFDDFATAIERLVGLHHSDTLYAASASFFVKSNGTWCSPHALFAASIVGRDQASLAAESSLRAVFETYDRAKQGDVANAEQLIAVHGLARLARRRPLDPATLQAVLTMLSHDKSDVTAVTPVMQLLTEIAPYQKLPSDLITLLWSNLRPEGGPGDFAPLISTNLLARNLRFLTPDQRTTFRQWLATEGPTNATMSNFHEALGFVALVEPLTEDQLHLLQRQLSSISRFPPQATNYRGQTVITASGDKAAIALGRVAQSSKLSTDITDRLANFAAARTELVGREDIIQGLAKQWLPDLPNLIDTIRSRLFASRTDVTRRSLEIEVAAAATMKLSASERATVLKGLTAAWRKEVEPTQRIALAKLIGSVNSGE